MVFDYSSTCNSLYHYKGILAIKKFRIQLSMIYRTVGTISYHTKYLVFP